MPVVVNNDGKCCALGEYAAGALRGTSVGVVLAIGTGIGGGIVIDGRVLRGANCFAGEFSFLRNDVQAPVSMENIFAGTGGWRALAEMVLAEKGLKDDGTVDGRKVFEWIADGDVDAQRGLDRYALMFDNMLVNLQAVIDPEVFAIAGGIAAMRSSSTRSRLRCPARSRALSPAGGIPPPRVYALPSLRRQPIRCRSRGNASGAALAPWWTRVSRNICAVRVHRGA